MAVSNPLSSLRASVIAGSPFGATARISSARARADENRLSTVCVEEVQQRLRFILRDNKFD